LKITVDESTCVGCRICELACSFARRKDFAPGEACIQVLLNDDGCLAIEIASDCAACISPLCVRFCPVGAIALAESCPR